MPKVKNKKNVDNVKMSIYDSFMNKTKMSSYM